MTFPVRAVLGSAFILLELGTLATPQAESMPKRGGFVAQCRYVRSLADDPILFPGDRGASHLHDFFGSKRTSATSTARQMRNGPTTCHVKADTAGYWSPTAYLNGRRLRPTKIRSYYFGILRRRIRAYPAGLKVIGGNPHAASAIENPHVTWSCGAKTPQRMHPYRCSPYARVPRNFDGVIGQVDMPSCWSGQGLSPDTLKYAWGAKQRACPDGFEIPLPHLSIHVHFGIRDPCAGAKPCKPNNAPASKIALTLSSGPFYTLHTDFWNTWNERRLRYFVNHCLNQHRRCSTL